MEDWIDNIIAHPLKRRNSYVFVQKALKGRQNIGGDEIPDNGLTKATPPWGGAGVGHSSFIIGNSPEGVTEYRRGQATRSPRSR